MYKFDTTKPFTQADAETFDFVNGFSTTPTGIRLGEYLVEESLLRLLVLLCGGGNTLQQPKVPGTRMRYDSRIEYGGKVYMVEFDGDSHFRDANVIYRDNLKDAAMSQAGISVIRIPYFVQLNTDTFRSLFGFPCPFTIDTTFPHGFIATKMTPASFCKLGLARYERILSTLPDYVVADIEKSLRDKIALGLPPEFVL